MPRSGLGVNQNGPIRHDLAPAQAAYLAWPASGQQEQPHRRAADRAFGFAATQYRGKFRQIVRAEQPPALRTPVADDTGAQVPGGFGPMAPRFGAIELVAQYLITALRDARLAVSVLVEIASDFGAQRTTVTTQR